jgi:hypothetical protein
MGNTLLNRRLAERQFYYTNLGGSFPLVPINQLAKNFYLKYFSTHSFAAGSINNSTPVEQMEMVWLKQYIISNGGTPPSETGGHPVGFRAALWRQALIVLGFGSQVTKNMNDNRFTFYLNAGVVS